MCMLACVLIPETNSFSSLRFTLNVIQASWLQFLGRLFQVDRIKWVSNVRPPVRMSVRPQKVSLISMKFGM